MIARKELSAEDQLRIFRLSEEADARLHEIGLIVARNMEIDPDNFQVGVGMPEVLQAGAGVRKAVKKHDTVTFQEKDGIIVCTTHNGGGSWECNYIGK